MKIEAFRTTDRSYYRRPRGAPVRIINCPGKYVPSSVRILSGRAYNGEWQMTERQRRSKRARESPIVSLDDEGRRRVCAARKDGFPSLSLSLSYSVRGKFSVKEKTWLFLPRIYLTARPSHVLFNELSFQKSEKRIYGVRKKSHKCIAVFFTNWLEEISCAWCYVAIFKIDQKYA